MSLINSPEVTKENTKQSVQDQEQLNLTDEKRESYPTSALTESECPG